MPAMSADSRNAPASSSICTKTARG
jgi:hypothetical protein